MSEELSKAEKKLVKSVDLLLKELEKILPQEWNKQQTADVFTIFLDFYK